MPGKLYRTRARDIDVFGHRDRARGEAELVQDGAECMSSDEDSAAAEYAGVEQRRYRDRRRVVGTMESDAAQIAAVFRKQSAFLDLILGDSDLDGGFCVV